MIILGLIVLSICMPLLSIITFILWEDHHFTRPIIFWLILSLGIYSLIKFV